MMETVTGDQCVVYSKRGYILYVDPHLLLAKITGGCHSPPPPAKSGGEARPHKTAARLELGGTFVSYWFYHQEWILAIVVFPSQK
jgi:hypothetical protein